MEEIKWLHFWLSRGQILCKAHAQSYLCKGLVSVQRYWEALEIINSSLKLAHNTLTTDKKEELRSLGAQIAYNIDGPTNGWDCARYIVSQNPYSFAAWNCYYKIMSRLDKHSKFLHEKSIKHEDCIPVNLIKGHHFTMISQHQAAARYYLKAYKLMPENALINLCVGTALINLALGLRLHNKHQCVLQGLAFLYNNLRLSGNSQEALYNLARAYHHVGLITLAVTYYEKVLAIHQKDHPIPKLPNDGSEAMDDLKPGYCDLRREAAYNLHIIYKSSGAMGLARQVLRDHCSL
ncbi:Tetratricopeptide-like helical [Cynara cardunculus var. scolymus]|uniref:Tetratricopeptide-like helical n=1 Tax=Cynara cardunculus var. scolymus TaxID=59895 RepID=A0A118K3Z8_CYNCS|nr:Tetratricopeptide-like helical [Cynara cardunculus var. scolymus]